MIDLHKSGRSGEERYLLWSEAGVDAGGMYSHIGMRLLPCDSGADVRLLLCSAHQNFMKTVHGGIVSALLDVAASAAVLRSLAPGERFGTTSLSVQLRRALPIDMGEISTLGTMTRRGRNVAFADACIAYEGEIYAAASATFFIAQEKTKTA